MEVVARRRRTTRVVDRWGSGATSVSVSTAPFHRVSSVMVSPTYRWSLTRRPSRGSTRQYPAVSPPTIDANTDGESGRGAQSQQRSPFGLTSAIAEPFASTDRSSSGGAFPPLIHADRRSATRASRWATNSGSSTRNAAVVSPQPTFTETSGPRRTAKASSSVWSSPMKSTASAPSRSRKASSA